jgi:hypothetical protein
VWAIDQAVKRTDKLYEADTRMREEGMLTRWLGSVALLVAMVFVVGCGQEEKKAPAKKVPAKKAEPDKVGEAVKEPVDKEPVDKEPVDKEPVDKEPVDKEPADKEPVANEFTPPTAADLLKKARMNDPGVTADSGKLMVYMEAQADAMNNYPDTDESFYAYADGAKLRLNYVVAGLADAKLLETIMVWDGKLKEGEQATAEQKALYFKELAIQAAEKAKSAPKADDGKPLTAGAALLNYLHDEAMEEAGKVAGNELVVPAGWRVGDPSTAAAGAPSAQDDTKKAAGAPSSEDAPAPSTAREGGDEVDAATGKAQVADDTAAPAADAVAPAVPANSVKIQGADVSTLLALATGDNAVTLQARAVVLAKLADAMDEAGKGSTLYGDWWKAVAVNSGKVLCAACGQLDKVQDEYVDELLFLSGNAGIVCKAAQMEIGKGIAAAEAVAKNCGAELGVAEADLALVTAHNVLELRLYALAHQMLDNLPPSTKDNTFFAQYEAVAKRVREQLLSKISLFPVIETFPAEQWEAEKEKLVLRSDLTAGAPAWNFMPIEMMVVDEKGVGDALRPVADVATVPFTFVDAAESLRFPGKVIADVEAIAKEIEAKSAKLKEEKRPFDERLNAYLEVVEIRGVKFKKPDFSIPSVIAAAKDLSAKAGPLEGEIFSYLLKAETAIVNHQRKTWPDYQDTVGKAVTYAVDQETPALLFKRVVDSLYYADYKESRLIKGTGALDTVPTVYFTEKFVADEVLDTTYKRPILVYVTDDGTVRFYPPTNKTNKGKMTAKRSPRKRDTKWPGGYRTQEDPRVPDPIWNLFMAYTRSSSKKFEEEVVGIATEMKKKWDNGNVFYIKAAEKAPSGVVVKVADLLANLPGAAPIAALDKAFPGYACGAKQVEEEWTETDGCINSIVVLFPDVEIPYLPGKKKVQEVESKVYCDKKDIAQKIAAKKGAIKFCYDPELQKNPNLKGKVRYDFTIGSAGRITTIAVGKDGLGNKNVVKCAMNIIKRINFRRPIGGECVIRYPYVFKP